MKKVIITIVSIVLLLALTFILTAPVALTQGEIACEQDVIVEAEDSLSELANRFYGDVLAFPAIVEATNARAATDGSYALIDDINVLQAGIKLCIPSAEDAQAILARSQPAGVSTVEIGPEFDRVGFPEGYQETFQVFYEFDRAQNNTARVIYANAAAASVRPGEPFPYGSILAMEVYRTQRDEAGNVALDENGRFVRDEMSGLFVMRKEPGFGLKYGDLRNGEWEYVAYRPDGTILVPPEATTSCASCHVEASQGKDWVFGAHRFFGEETPPAGENEINVVDYTFQPAALTVKVGTEVKWVSHDIVFHTVTANDLSFSSVLRPGQSFSHTFETPGVFEYFSAIYPAAKGRIEVVN